MNLGLPAIPGGWSLKMGFFYSEPNHSAKWEELVMSLSAYKWAVLVAFSKYIHVVDLQ